MSQNADDYDSPWKTALVRYFPEFLAFYFPAAYQEIDWTQPHHFLEQELAQIVADAELGRRRVDGLVQLSLINGKQQWVYVHVEVQGQKKSNFAERLFIYNYRLYDRYRRPVATLAVLTDADPRWRPQEFSYSVLGSQTSIQFATVKILDYVNQVDTLLENPNPFALVTAAHLLTQQTRKNPSGRYEAKWRLARLLYERDWDKQRILDLFGIIDWLMRLPQDLEKRLWTSIQDLERNQTMPYVLSIERIARQEGRQAEARALLQRLLTKKFGTLTPEWEARLAVAPLDVLEVWGENILDATSLDAVLKESQAETPSDSGD